MLERLDTWVRTLGLWGLGGLAMAAWLEYVVPPVPGDMALLLAGALVARGDLPAVPTLAAVLVGSAAGIVTTFGAGRLVGRRVDALPEGRLFPGLSHAQVRSAQELLRRRGLPLLLANRFLPAVRALVFLAAGAAGLPLPRVLWAGTVSAAAWAALLLGAGYVIGDHADRLEAFLVTYQRWAFAAVALALVTWAGVAAWRRRHPPG